MSTTTVNLLGIDFGDPFDIRTFSGSSPYIWAGLKKNGALADVFSPYPPEPIVNFYKLMSFRPDMRKWRATWRRSLIFRQHLSGRADKYIKQVKSGTFNSTLQIGAYFDLTRSWGGCKSLLADNNCVISQATNVNFQSSEAIFRKQYEYEKKVYNSMDRIFCFSSYLAKSFARDFGCSESRIKVVHAGINIDENIISNQTKDYNTKMVLFSGFDFKNKGGEVLLEAFRKVVREVPGAKLVMLGPKERAFPEYVINHGPLSKSDPGHLSIMADAYKSASVFVLPTLADAFPNVIREAMAARLPCVATDICAIPEMVIDGKTGYLTPLGDSDVLAERLIDLLKNPDLCRKMGEAGYERYKSLFTWDAVCDKIIREISGVLD